MGKDFTVRMEEINIEKVKYVIKEIMRKKLLLNKDIQDSVELTEMGINSLQMVELIVELENKFEFEFDIEKLSYGILNTVDSIALYVLENAVKKKD